MIVDSLVISLVVALIARGKISNLAQVEFRGIWLVIVAALAQYGAQWCQDQGIVELGNWGPLLYLPALVGTFLFAVLNRHLPGFPVVGLGVLANLVVIAANGGRMPVSIVALHQAGIGWFEKILLSGDLFTHAPISAGTNLQWLGDIIPLPRPYPRPKVFSIGDLTLAVGVVTFILTTLQPWPLQRRTKAHLLDDVTDS
jgi:hypothetical protein